MSKDYDKKYYIGKSMDGKWASVYAYKPKNPHIFLEKGEVFAVISLEGPKSFSASTAGNIILDYLHESYFECNDVSPLICLENALEKTAEKLAEIVERDTNIGDAGLDLNIASLVIVDKIVYFVVLGKGEIYMYRDSDIVKVTNALKDPKGGKMIKSASTVVEDEDRFMLLTPQAESVYLKDEVNHSLEQFNEKELASKPLQDESLTAFILISEIVEHKIDKKEDLEPVVVPVRVEKTKEIEVENSDEEVDDEDAIESDKQEKDTLEDEDESEFPHVPDEPDDVMDKNTVSYSPSERISGVFEQVKSKISEVKVFDDIKKKINIPKSKKGDQSTFEYVVSNVKEKAQIAYKFLYNLIWIKFLQMDQGIYLRNSRRGTNWRLIGTIAVLILFVGYIFISISASNSERNRIIEESKKQLSDSQETYESLKLDVDKTTGNFNDYLSKRNGYETTINENIESLSNMEVIDEDQPQKDELINNYESLKMTLSRTVSISDSAVIFDYAESVDEGANLSDLEISEGKLYITDENRGTVYSLETSGSNNTELATGLKNPTSITVNDDGQLIVSDKTPNQSLFEVNKTNGNINRFVGIIGTGMETIVAIDDFDLSGTNRVYFVKTEISPVQYIQQAGAGFAGAYDKFSDATYSSAKDICVVDGKVYLLMPGQGAIRFYGDDQETLEYVGLNSNEAQSLRNASAFEVMGEYIFFGDNTNNSVYVFYKQLGQDITKSSFVAKFQSDNQNLLNNIKEIKLDSSSNSLFVLDGSRVLKLSMSQIDLYSYSN